MVTGNQETIGLLEYWLEQARAGDINYIALAAIKGRYENAYDYAGAFGSEDLAQDALRTLIQELEAIQAARKLGPRDFTLDASHVEYPLSEIAPFNWDFLIWLIDAEMTRRRLGAPAPLRVAFSRQELLVDGNRNFFERVMKPLVPLVGGVMDQAALGGRHKQIYVLTDIVVAARSGESVPRLKAARSASELVASRLHGIAPITVTLREAQHLRYRNSNMSAWTRFAHELEKAGERVIFVRDTANANEPLDGFATFPRASFDVATRMALYEQAKVNLFVSNGPGSLAWFSDRPYLYFVNLKPGHDEYQPNDPRWWLEGMGIAEGEQWPWALPHQRMIWRTDDFENICEAWQALG